MGIKRQILGGTTPVHSETCTGRQRTKSFLEKLMRKNNYEQFENEKSREEQGRSIEGDSYSSDLVDDGYLDLRYQHPAGNGSHDEPDAAIRVTGLTGISRGHGGQCPSGHSHNTKVTTAASSKKAKRKELHKRMKKVAWRGAKSGWKHFKAGLIMMSTHTVGALSVTNIVNSGLANYANSARRHSYRS